MSLPRALKGRRKNRRFQKQLHKALLVHDRQPDEVSFIDGPASGLLSGSDDEIAETAALEFRGASDDPQRIRGNPGFDTRAAVGFLGHGSYGELYGILPDKAIL